MQQIKSDLSIFWKQRFAIHGHTGWANRFIFEFDQQCRILVFSSWLAANLPIAGKALDFGCGTGDFSRFLVGLGWAVMGYDKYIKPDFKHPRFEFSNLFPGLKEQATCYDLIISITVLDHIKDDDEFLRSLLSIRGLLKPKGSFFFLETSPASFMRPSFCKAFRSMHTWREFIDRAGLQLEKTIPFFNPEEASIPAWEAYRKHSYSQLGRILLHYGFKGTVCQRLLGKAAKDCLLSYGYTEPRTSSLNIMVGHRA
jgi:SAM-dependent methyltransferase